MKPARIPICYVISSVTTGKAGTEGRLLQFLRHIDRTKFSPTLIVLQKSSWTETFSDPDIELITLDFESFKKVSNWKIVSQLKEIFKDKKARIVELYYTDAHFSGALAARWAGVPVILSARRNLGYQYSAKDLSLSKFANRFVTRFIANSREVTRVMSQIEGIPENKFEIIYNGLDIAKFESAMQRQPEQQFMRFIDSKKVVSIAANLRPVKNIQGFLTAAYTVTQQRDDVVFVIMGSGSEEISLKSFAEQLGIGERFYWTGSVASTAPYLAHSDICVLSSDSEGFSNAIVEYMAAGLPVVATRVGGAAEAILDSQTGFLVTRGNMQALAERIVELLSNPGVAKSFGESGRARVAERFTLAREIAAYQDLYERLSPTE